MSELLDERVVEMRFDNADFERNVGQSIKTINKLKESLDFDDAGQSFDNLAASAAKVDLSPMEESIEKIAVKFNMLELVAANVLSNIVSKAVNAGMQFAKSVSTDQVTAGWSKYQRKTEAVQTIIAATGETIDTVNQKLEKLIWFADETSYDFVDMTNNIGKFTSAGVDLDTAVKSMMGISNWAALSGAGIQQASRAMYNLSQSIGMGAVKIADWRSIELANMATKEFKDVAIAMGLEYGTLKNINGEITTLDGKVTVTAATMRESLKSGWFNTDVLNATLGVFSEFTEQVKEFQETHPEFDTVSRAMEEMVRRGLVDVDSVGYRAFVAAQEAKTLTEAINATKDAVSSGWMRTFELIFGNYDQAKKLWTSLANDLYDIFAAPGDARNEKLADIMKSNYQKLLDEMPDPDEFNQSIYKKLFEYTKNNLGEQIANDIFSKFESVEDLLKNVNYYDSELNSVIKSIADDNSVEMKKVSELARNLKNKQTSLKQIAIQLATNQFGADEETARKNLEQIGWDYDYVLEFAEAWKNGIQIDWDSEQKDFEKYLDERYNILLNFNQKLSNFDLFSGLREFGGRDKLVASYENIMSFFKNLYLLILGISNGFGNLFGSGSFLSTAIDGFYNLSRVLGFAGRAFEDLTVFSDELFNMIIPESWDRFLHGYDIVNPIGNVSEQIEHVPGLIDRLTSYYEEHLKILPEEVQNTITTITGNVTEFFNSIPEKVTKLKKDIFGVEKEYMDLNSDGKWEKKIEREGGLINEWKTQLESFGDGIIPRALDGISNFLNRISGYLFGYKNDAGEFEGIIAWIYNKVQSFINLLKTIGKNAKDIFNTVFEDIKTFFTRGKYSFSNATIWSFPSRLKKHFEDLKNTPAFQEIKRFFLGEIAPDGTIIKNNIFGKISRVVSEFVSSKPFQDVKAFFFGKEANTQTFGQASHIPGIFEKIGNFVKNLVTSIPYQEIKKFILGDIESREPSIFGKISGAIQSIKESTAYKSIHDFFFGNEESDILNLFGKIRGLFESIEASAPFQAVRAVIDFLTGKQSFSSALSENKDIFIGRESHQGVSKVRGALGENTEEVDATQSAFVRLGAIINSIREFASKAKDKIIEFGTAVFGALNNARKWLGLDWDFVKLEDGTSKWQRIPGAIDNVTKSLKAFSSSPAVVAVKDFFFGNKEKGKDNIFGKISKTVSEFVSSKPFQDVKMFFLGEIAPDGTVIKNNIFGKISRVVSEFVSSKPFQDVKTFLFGKEANTQTFGQASHIPGIFEKISKAITNIISSKEFQEIKKFFFGEKASDGTTIKNNIFGKISRIISEFISINSGFANFHDFIFGNQELEQDNFLTRTINFISSKFEELKRMSPLIQEIRDFIEKKFHEIYVLFNGYDIYNPKMLETTHIPGKLEPIKKAIEEFFNKIKDLNPFKSNTKKQKGFFEIIGDFFKDITKLFTGIFDGIQFLMRVPRLIHNLLPIFGGIAILLLGIGGLNIGKLEIQSPLGNMVDMLTDVVKSVAIIAGLIVGLSVYLRFLDLKGWGCLALAAVIIGAITWGLVQIAKEINGDDKKEKSGIIEGFQNAASMYFMISFIQALTSLIAALAISIAGLSFVAAIIGPWNVIAAAVAVGAVIVAVGFAIKLMNDSFEKSKDAKGKLHTHASELFGLAFVLFSIANLLSTIVIAFSWLYFLTKGKTIEDFETPLILIGGILTAIAALIAVMGIVIKSISKAGGISKKALLALGSLEVFIFMLSVLVTAISVSNHWESVAAMFLGITFVLLAMGRLLKVISSIKDVNIKPVLAILSITAVLGTLVVLLLALANALKVDIDFKRIFNLMASIVEMAVAFGLVAVVIGAIGEFAHSLKNFSFGGTLVFIVKVVGIVAIIAAAVILIAGLIAKIEGAKEYIEGAGEILETISEALGKLVGGFIGGIGEGITDSMPAIATNLSDFMNNLAPFLDGIKNVKHGHARGMGYLVELMLGITGTNLLSAFNGLIEFATGWLTGGSNLDNAFALLSKAADGLVEFSGKVKDVSYNDVKHAAKIIPALLDIAVNDNYKQGGIAGIISSFVDGSVDLKGLFEKLNNGAADGLREFESKVKGLTYEDVEAAADIIPALLNIVVDDRYKQGGIAGIISSFVDGSVDLKGLFEKLNNGAADGLKTFESKVKGLKYDDVKAAADVIPALLNIAVDDRYKQGGIAGIISSFVGGSIDLKGLFEKLNNGAADGLREFESKVKGLTYEDVKAAADVIPALLNIVTDPNYRSGSKWDIISKFLTGDVDLKGLFEKLNNGVVDGLKTFESNVKDLKYDDVKAAADIIPALLNIVSDENYKSGGISEFLRSFIEGEISFEELFDKLNNEIVPGFVDFAGALKNVTLDKAERASEILPKILNMLSDDHYKSGGIGGWISKLIEGETNYQGMFDILLGEGKNKGLIDYLGELSEKLKSKELVDLDFSAVNNAVDAMKNVFELMSFDTSNLITDNDEVKNVWGDYTFLNDATKLESTLIVLREKVVPEIKQLQEDLEATGVKSSYISSIIGSYSELIQSLIDLSKFDGMIGAPEIGNFVIEGLINALRAGETRVEDAARSVANAVKNGLTLTLQIQSPSKVAYKIGQFITEGLTNGLLAGESLTWAMARQLGEGTIKALEKGAARYDAYGLSQHAINMVTSDLVDENIFNMPDFSFINRLGMEDIDFEKMRSFLHEKFGEVLDPTMIDGFVNSYMKEFNELPKEIKDSDYAKVMTDIAKGEYGLGQDAIIDALEEELGSVSAAEQAWEDYNDVLKGNIKINKDLLKQKKENPPMTYEEYMDMINHEQEGIDLANKGFFDKLAKANGTTWEEEAEKLGYNPKITQKALDQIYMSSDQFYATLEKMYTARELEAEENRLLLEQQEEVNKLAKNVEGIDPKKIEIVDDSGTRKTVEAIEDESKSVEELTDNIKEFDAEAAKAASSGTDSYTQAMRNQAKTISETAETTKKLETHYEKLNYDALNDLAKRIQNGSKNITEADAELLRDLNAATITEGKFETGKQRKEAYKNHGIKDEYLDTIYNIGSQSNIDKYINDTFKISDAAEKAAEKVSDSETSIEASSDSFYNSLSKKWQKVSDKISESVDMAINDGAASITIDSSILEPLGQEYVDKFQNVLDDTGKDGKLEISFSEIGMTINGKEANPAEIKKQLGLRGITQLIMEGLLPTSDLGGFGNIDELDINDFFKQIQNNISGIKGDGNWFVGLLEKGLDFIDGIVTGTEKINNNGLDLPVDTSELQAAKVYIEDLYNQYKLSKAEQYSVQQGYQKLISGDKIAPIEEEALKKFFNGVSIGTYGNIDDAREWMEQTLGVNWDTFLTYNARGLDTFTSSAMAYSREVKNLREAGEDYTSLDLVKDIHNNKWGNGLERKKALEAANIDYDKAQEAYAEWLKGGDEAVKKLGLDYGILTDAQVEALKQQEKYEEALATTPQGAFKSIGDFLKGVTQVLEKDDTAASFTKFVEDIVESLKTVELKNAPAFEQIGNFFKMIKEVSNSSNGIIKDFGPLFNSISSTINSVEIDSEKFEQITSFLHELNAFTGMNQNTEDQSVSNINIGSSFSSISDSINTLGASAEQFTPIADFLRELINLSESASKVIEPFSQLVIDLVNIPVDGVGSRANEIAIEIVEGILEIFRARYADFTAVGQQFIIQLINGMLSQTSYAVTAANAIATAILAAFTTGANSASQIGSQFMSSFAEGLASDESKALITDAFNSLFGKDADASEGLLGLESDLETGAIGISSLGLSLGSDFVTSFATGISSEESKALISNAFSALFGAPTDTGAGLLGMGTGTDLLGMGTGLLGGSSIGASFGQSFGNEFVTGFITSVTSQQEVITEQLAPVIQGLTTVVDAFNSIEDPGEAITTFVNDLGRASEESIESEAMENITALADQIKSAFDSTVPDGFSMGYNFVFNLYLGLAAGWAEFGGAIRSMMSAAGGGAVDALNSGAGIASPSKKTKKSGEYLGEGFIIGIKSKIGDVYNMATDMGQASVDGITDAIDSHSPSEVTKKLGANAGEGFILGEKSKIYGVYKISEEFAERSIEPLLQTTSRSTIIAKDLVTNFGNSIAHYGNETELFNPLIEQAHESVEEIVEEYHSVNDYFNNLGFKNPVMDGFGKLPHNLFTSIEQAAAKAIISTDELNTNLIETANEILNINKPDSMVLEADAYIAAGNALRQFGHVSSEQAKLLQEVWNDVMRGKYGVVGDPTFDRNEQLIKKIGMSWKEFSKYDPLHNGNFDLSKSINDSILPIDTLREKVNSVKDLVYLIWDGALGVGDEFRKIQVETLGYSYDTVKKYVSDLKYNTGSINWDEAEKEATESGASIIDGLKAGLDTNKVIATKQVGSIAKEISKTFSDKVGINSPSEVFMEYGRYIVEGLAIGISNNTEMVADNMTDLSNILTSTFNENVISLSDMVEDNLNAEPVITPVIDMSEVYDSANTIDSILSKEQAISISTSESMKKNQNGETSESFGPTYNFTQNNYSPKALSRLEIYRQTRNQFAQMKNVIGRIS